MSLATNAAYYRRVGDMLTQWGWGAAINWWPGWATRTNGGATMQPQAVTVHHTGGTATATSYLVNPTDRPKLKVLANVHIDQLERRIRFICAGGASHGGYTHQPCYDRVIAGTAPLDRDLVPGADSATFSINKRTVGIEVDGAGGKNEWDEWTYRATVATSAACQVAGGWPVGDAPRVGAHKEHTRRKPGDPFVNMGTFRRDVLDCIKQPWAPTPVSGEPVKLGSRLLSKVSGQDQGADVAELAELLIARGHDVGTPVDVFGPRMDAAVRTIQAAAGLPETGVVDAATLTVLLGEPNPSEPDGGTDVPTPEPAPVGKLRVGLVTGIDPRFGGSTSQATVDRYAAAVKSMSAPLVALAEIPDDARSKQMRTRLRRALPGGEDRWKVWTSGDAPGVAILFDGSQAKPVGGSADVERLAFGKAGYHGGVVALFDVTGAGRVAVGGYHLQPNSIASLDSQAASVQAVAKAALQLGAPVTVLAGDGVNSDDWLPGWTVTRVGKSAKTPTYKTAITDRIHIKSRVGTVQVTGYGTRKTPSDHKAVVIQVAIGSDL